MDLTRATIEKNRITLVIVIIVTIAGLATYFGMPRAEDPGFIIRMALVATYFPGASPERVEQLVTDPIEAAIQEIPELDFVASQSRTGVSLVFVNIQERYRELRPIWDDLRRRVEDVQSDLPEGVYGPFVDDDFGDVFGIVATLTSDGFSPQETRQYAEQIRDELLFLDDVARVDLYGVQEERIYIEYSNARLSELGISPMQLAQMLEGVNIVMPGGSVAVGPERLVLEPTGSFRTLEELGETVISIPGRSEVLFLRDVAESIELGYVDPPEGLVSSTGRPAVAIAISMREGGNIIELGDDAMATLDRVQADLPLGLELDTVSFQPHAVDLKVKDFADNLLQAIAVVLAMMLLLLGLRTGLIVAAMIPVGMVATLWIMGIFDIGLDQVSLASLIIAMGLLVDNGVVIAESIQVALEEGHPPLEATLKSARELNLPILVSCLTTASAFLPIFLAESATGEYTAPLFLVVTITLLCSWFLSITVTPWLCLVFLKVKPKAGDQYDTRFYRGYRAVLTAGLKNRVLVGIFMLALFFGALAAFRFVPVLFFPPSDKPLFTAALELPPGTAIERTQAVVADIERFMRETLLVEREEDPGAVERFHPLQGADGQPEGIINWVAYIGHGGPRFTLGYTPELQRPEYAIFVVNTTSQAVFAEAFDQLETYVREHFPEATLRVKPLDMGPPVDYPVEVRVSGRDTDQLFALADEVRVHLQETPGIAQVVDDWGARTKRLVVDVDQPRARREAVSSRDVAMSLQTALSGIEVSQFRGEDVIPIALRSAAADGQELGNLEAVSVFSQATGRSVPLAQIAELGLAFDPSRILRRDRMRTVTVRANLDPGITAAQINVALVPWLQQQEWGLGYGWQLGGESETSGKANQSIADKLPIALIIVVFMLVWQFNSFRRPLIILVTIPLGIIGVVIGLLVARSYFGFMTLLGIVSLSGVVVNNAIVLIDRIEVEIKQNGLDPRRAIIESAQRRFRPIMVSTFTTVVGLFPLWIGGGPMWEPMAVALIFGQSFATILTLGLVPILYSAFFRVGFKDFRY